MENDIKTKIINLTSLPTVPVIISRLIKIMKKENASIDDLVDVIKHDQSITTKIVSIANSPFFGYPGRINSIEQAVLMLGFDLVKSISLSVSIFTIFPIPYVSLKNMWSHAFKVASLSSLLYNKTTGKNSGVSFLCGLLHDIGRAIFLTLTPTNHSAILQELYKLKSYELLDAEKKLFQCTHNEAGKLFLEKLFFPEEIIIPIYYHHYYDKFIDYNIPHKDVVQSIYLAEGLIDLIRPDAMNDGQWSEKHLALIKQNDINEVELEEIKGSFFEIIESSNNFFEI